MKIPAVYIITAHPGGPLHVKVTGDLRRIMWAHRNALPHHRIKSYPDCQLLYFEVTTNRYQAMLRKRQICRSDTRTNVDMIHQINPTGCDITDQIEELAATMRPAEIQPPES